MKLRTSWFVVAAVTLVAWSSWAEISQAQIFGRRGGRGGYSSNGYYGNGWGWGSGYGGYGSGNGYYSQPIATDATVNGGISQAGYQSNYPMTQGGDPCCCTAGQNYGQMPMQNGQPMPNGQTNWNQQGVYQNGAYPNGTYQNGVYQNNPAYRNQNVAPGTNTNVNPNAGLNTNTGVNTNPGLNTNNGANVNPGTNLNTPTTNPGGTTTPNLPSGGTATPNR